VDFWIGTATDIDDRKRIEEAQRFLLDAGTELSRSLDYRAALATVARLAVPRIADWCSVEIVEPDETIVQLAVEHADPEKTIFARELQQRYPPGSERGVAAVISAGRSLLMPLVPVEMVSAGSVGEAPA